MNKVKDLIHGYLHTQDIMQLATSVNDQPWVCNLHYLADKNGNIYWLSKPSSRHSTELLQNPKAALVIKVHEETPQEKYVIGISMEGNTEVLKPDTVKEIAKDYQEKHGTSEKFINKVLSGEASEVFYKFTPTCIVLFDTKNFKDNPRQTWEITANN